MCDSLKNLSEAGIKITFATPEARPASCDLRMLNGNGLGPLAPLLAADARTRTAYRELEQSHEFTHPLKWTEIASTSFDGLLLPGGHAPGMKEYLESTVLQDVVAKAFQANQLVAAICHGVVLAARSRVDQKSVLQSRRTTALLERQELLAWSLTKFWLGDYYRTYPETVEAEVRNLIGPSGTFVSGPLPILRDKPDCLHRGFVVQDGNYLSARWPGDAHLLGFRFLEMLNQLPTTKY